MPQKKQASALQRLNQSIRAKNPNLVPKEVDIHPKGKPSYKAVRWVKRNEEETKENNQASNNEDYEVQEEVVDSDEQAAKNIFGEKAKNDKELIQQYDAIRTWIIDAATDSSIYDDIDQNEINEKIQWLNNNVNDELQNELSEPEIIEFKKNKGGGVNNSYKVTLDNGIEGIFKESSSEAERYTKVIGGPQFLREVATYKFSQMFEEFQGLVPTTSLREGISEDGGFGSIQEFLNSAEVYGDAKDSAIQNIYEEFYGTEEYEREINTGFKNIFNKVFHKEDKDTLENIVLFDLLIQNTDRHEFNFMERDGYLVLIDNGLTFPAKPIEYYPQSNEIIRNLKIYNEKISDRHSRLLENMIVRKNEIEKELTPYLDKDALNLFFGRIRKMYNTGKYNI